MLLLSCSAATAEVPPRGSTRAEVLIERAGERGIAVYADTDRDGAVDERFLLAFEDAEAGELGFPNHFNAAHIEYEPGYVRIVAGNQAIELYVNGSQTAAWNPNGFRVWRRSGYGLAHNVGVTNIHMPSPGRDPGTITAQYCNADSDCYPGHTDDGWGNSGSSGNKKCDSGGAGATNCSVSGSQGCSVTCGAGYYACCNFGGMLSLPSCTCVKG